MWFSCVPDVFNEVVAATSVIVVLIVVVVVMVAIIVVVVGVDVVVSNFETDKNHQIDENGFGNWNLIDSVPFFNETIYLDKSHPWNR